MNTKNEKLGYVLLLEYKSVYVLLNISVKDE